MKTAVEFHNISKNFPGGIAACKDISFSVNEGEIVCVAGENGAGKSTLMRILYGLETPSSGFIEIRGKRVQFKNPFDAQKAGIGMVHQHFMLFDDFTVTQNVTMGSEPKNLGLYDQKKASEEVDKVIEKHSFSVVSSKKVSSLTVGEKQQTEIIRLLYQKSQILILDEPTAVLTETETQELFTRLRALREEGRTIILITHKLKEIKAISDRIMVMRKGELVGVMQTSASDEREIALAMFGENLTAPIERTLVNADKMLPVLEFKNVSVLRRNQQRPLLDDISFVAKQGEILAFAGVAGNGLGVLEAVLGGFIPISSGKIFHHNTEISKLDSRQLRKRHLAYVPADRLGVGSSLQASVSENIMVNNRDNLTAKGILQKKKITAFANKLISRFSISAKPAQRLGTLSGGNIQKVILAREIYQNTDYIIFSEPTWGLDASSSQFVYHQMENLKFNRCAILLISSNLDEILEVADRIAIFCKGKIVAVLDNDGKTSKTEIGHFMTGGSENA